MVRKRQKGRRKHVPMRTCVACRQAQPKRSLVRIVFLLEQGIVVDLTSKLAGRGAYLCQNPACWEKAEHGTLLARALRTTVSDDDKVALLAYWERELKGSEPAALYP